MASANPATMPLGSAAGTEATAETTPEVPIDTTTSPAAAPRPSAAAMLSPVPGPSTAPAPNPWAGAGTPASAGPSTRGRAASCPSAAVRMSRRYSPVAGEKYPVPEASPRSVTRASSPGAPASIQVSQSCGRHTAATRAAASGSCSASQASLDTVNEATGTDPTPSAQACGPPSCSVSRAACGAERVSFHSRAGRTTSPAESRATMPCCWAPTATAATSSRPPAAAAASCRAVHQCRGSISVPSG